MALKTSKKEMKSHISSFKISTLDHEILYYAVKRGSFIAKPLLTYECRSMQMKKDETFATINII